MASLIASVGTNSTATKGNAQRHGFVDANGRHWRFYMKSGTANTLFYAYTSDPQAGTWTESSVALGGTVVQDGGTIDVTPPDSNGVFLITYYSSVTAFCRYLRGQVSTTTISWSANTLVRMDFAAAAGDNTASLALDTSTPPIPASTYIDGGGNVNFVRATNGLSATFADNGWTSWTMPALNDVVTRTWAGYVASGQFMVISDDLNGTPLLQSVTSTAGAFGSWTTIYSGAAVDRATWSVAQLSASAIYVVGISAASTLTLRLYNGSAWSTLTAPSWPAGGVKTDGLTITTDGTNLWALVIQNDSANTVSYNKYTVSGGTWGGWTNLVTSTATRNYLTKAGLVAGSLAPVMWTQTNGSNYDVYSDAVSTGGGGGGSTPGQIHTYSLIIQ